MSDLSRDLATIIDASVTPTRRTAPVPVPVPMHDDFRRLKAKLRATIIECQTTLAAGDWSEKDDEFLDTATVWFLGLRP